MRGSGLEGLRAALQREAALVRPRNQRGPFRMPIDRVFSVAGAGTVVTGSVWSGSAEVGDHLRILPPERSARVRSIEVHGEGRERALPGNRAALGLAGVDRAAVRRGDTLVDGRLPWEPTTALDVRIELLRDAPRALTARTRVHLHLGTAEVIARVLPRSVIQPGEAGLARLACEAALVARGGDRFVLRSYSPVSTIGGGVVLDPFPPRRRALWPDGLDSSELVARIAALLQRHPPGAPADLLALRAGASRDEVETALAADGRFRSLSGGWVLTSVINAARDQGLDLVTRYHSSHPSHAGIPVETLRRGIHRATPVAEAAVSDLAAEGAIVVEAGTARLLGFEPRIAGGTAGVEQVIELVRAGGLGALPVDELQRELEGIDVPGALRLGAGSGRIEAVTPGWYVGCEALAGFKEILTSAGPGGEITVAGVREQTGLSRKYLIPLLEWADRQGITRRHGEARRLT